MLRTLMRHHHDFLVLGGGIAGLSFALQAARHGSVAVLTKRGRSESNTAYAQGGIAAVSDPRDRSRCGRRRRRAASRAGRA